MRIRRFAGALAIGAAMVLSGCPNRDSGDTGSGTPTPPAPVSSTDLSGRWNVSETGVTNCPGSVTYSNNYETTIAQTGSNLAVTTPSGTFNGTLNGASVTWRGSYPENGGTTTITNLNATVASDGNSFSGSSSWTWTNVSQSCSGTTNPFTGTRIVATIPNAPSGLGASALSPSTIRLTWTDNAGNETGFKVERGASAAGPFTEIVVLGANATTYDSTGLAASTPYYFRVRAAGAAGDSPYSNVASATTSVAALTAPTNLVATPVSSSVINLSWTDASSNETGFRIERGTNVSNFAEIAQVGANVVSYASTGLAAGAAYLYRVRAFNAVGNSGYSNTAPATTMGAATFSLTVAKSGLGAGTVSSSPAGLSCGTTCVAQFPSGNTVTLTASANVGSVFSSWGGCDSTVAATCTVQMNSSRTVTATFALSTAANITVSVPPTNSTGNYTVSWTLSGGLATTNWTVQEAPNTGFASVTTYFSSDTTSPYQLPAFVNKPDGTYCYRVLAPGTSSTYSAPACITVARPTAAVLRIANNTKYDMIDIRLNGAQRVSYPNGILIGQSADFVFNGAGTVNYNLGVGFYSSDQSREVWFTLSGTTSVTLGTTTTVTFNNPTIGQLLSGFRTSSNWDGLYFDANLGPHTARFNFASSGGWTLFDDGSRIGTGTVTLVSWQNRSPIVTFRTCPTCTDINIAFPFASFQLRNGPSSWPTIEYVWQP